MFHSNENLSLFCSSHVRLSGYYEYIVDPKHEKNYRRSKQLKQNICCGFYYGTAYFTRLYWKIHQSLLLYRRINHKFAAHIVVHVFFSIVLYDTHTHSTLISFFAKYRPKWSSLSGEIYERRFSSSRKKVLITSYILPPYKTRLDEWIGVMKKIYRTELENLKWKRFATKFSSVEREKHLCAVLLLVYTYFI